MGGALYQRELLRGRPSRRRLLRAARRFPLVSGRITTREAAHDAARAWGSVAHAAGIGDLVLIVSARQEAVLVTRALAQRSFPRGNPIAALLEGPVSPGSVRVILGREDEDGGVIDVEDLELSPEVA